MKKITFVFVIIYLLGGAYSVFAYVMSSSNYRIQSDSVNVGGVYQTSTNYKMEDTIGEIATGISTTTLYKLKAGYQQMQESYISISFSDPSVNLLPSIGGLSGGTATGTATTTVITDNEAGYSLYLKATSSPALSSGLFYFSDYTPAAAGTPDYSWLILADSSEFGFSPEGSHIVQKFKDNGADTCAVGANDTADKCWYNFLSSNENIALSYSSNHPSGTQTIIKLKGESGASNLQEEGTYQGVIIATAVAN